MKKNLISILFFVGLCSSVTVIAHAANFSFANDLYYGLQNNADVTSLQKFLTNQQLYAGPITGNFFSLTLQAVKQFQSKNSILPAAGYFGTMTRAKANAIAASGTLAFPPSANATGTGSVPLWGAYVGDGLSSLGTFEAMVGKPVNIRAYFVGWPDSFPTSIAAPLKPAGKTLLIFWESTGYTELQMTNGSVDSYIASFAQQIKAYGGQVILAPWAEMNGNWSDWGGTVGDNSKAGFIAAWRHVHDVFAGAGVSNVKWAWNVNNVSVPDIPSNSIAGYYPGGAYVDYVGVDGFNFGNPWQTWNQVFPSTLVNQLAAYGKPLYIFSTGSVPGGQKAQWIADMGVGIKNDPQIAGWVWFNQNGSDGDWLVSSDPVSLAAFKAILP